MEALRKAWQTPSDSGQDRWKYCTHCGLRCSQTKPEIFEGGLDHSTRWRLVRLSTFVNQVVNIWGGKGDGTDEPDIRVEVSSKEVEFSNGSNCPGILWPIVVTKRLLWADWPKCRCRAEMTRRGLPLSQQNSWCHGRDPLRLCALTGGEEDVPPILLWNLHGYNPIHIVLGVSPIEHSRTYFWLSIAQDCVLKFSPEKWPQGSTVGPSEDPVTPGAPHLCWPMPCFIWPKNANTGSVSLPG